MTKLASALLFGTVIFSNSGGVALPQSDFYAGKNILMVVATDPGGSGDLRTRAFLPLLRKYIPGNPAIVVQYMPGAGGKKPRTISSKAPGPTDSPSAPC